METRRTGQNERRDAESGDTRFARLRRDLRTGGTRAAAAAAEWFRSPLASLGLFGGDQYVSSRPPLPAPYAAIKPIARRAHQPTRRPHPPARARHQHHRDRPRPRQERSEFSLRRTVERASEKLENTKHLWVFIAFLYMFVALFALVVALSVMGS
jgi:hypothetical protein